MGGKKIKDKKVLIGSVSIISTLILVVTSISSLYFIDIPNEPLNEKKLKVWDIIVPEDYESIQDAIDNSKDGDRIFVKSGTYIPKLFYGSLLIKKNNIVICGESPSSTIINGKDIKTVVILEADNVTLCNLTIIGNGVNGTLLYIEGEENTIYNNTLNVKDHYDGIEYGIKLFKTFSTNFSKNKINDGNYGIDISGSDNNTFWNNVIQKNDIAIDSDGILSIDFSRGITEKLYYKPCYNNKFLNNRFKNNRQGIVIDENHDSVFIDNIFQHNNNHGILLSNCKNCTIKNNLFNDGGLDLFGFEKEHFIHMIEENTVNGKPLYYFINEFNFNVPSDAGQIIIVDCDSARIKNVIINNTSTGILIAFSENIKVERSEFNKNNRGVFLYYSTRCNFNFNNFINNKFHVSFVGKGWFNSKSNKWRYNYYEKIFKTRLFKRIPEPIRGICHLKNRFDRFRIIPFIIVTEFDLRPASHPY